MRELSKFSGAREIAMKQWLVTFVSVVALTASANAADMYSGGLKDGYVPVNTWSGYYFGGNGGYGWNQGGSNVSAFANDGGITDGPNVRSFDANGGFGGVQAGRNWQYNNLVLGVETDIQWADIKGSRTATASADGGDVTASAHASSELEWFGTLRGRAGYGFNNAFIYATAGLAYGGVKDHLTLTTGGNDPGTGSLTSSSKDSTAVGAVVGGGLEYAFSPAWSLKGEYQYIDLRKFNQGFGVDLGVNTGNSATAVSNSENIYHTVRVGLNYHFGMGYEPLK
jgi:outer membrane immunogenic protein